MARFFTSTLLAFVCAFLALGAAAGPAMAAGVYYRAELASPPSAGRIIVRDVIWRCDVKGCVAGESNSRAATDCAALARQVGALRSFTVDGRALSAEELEKCNAKAR
jgi:hypothetical protein